MSSCLPVRRTQTGPAPRRQAYPAGPADRPVPCRLTRPRAPDSVSRARALALGNPATLGGTVFPRPPGPFVVFSSARVRHPGFPTSCPLRVIEQVQEAGLHIGPEVLAALRSLAGKSR